MPGFAVISHGQESSGDSSGGQTADSGSTIYIGNKNSGKLHLPSCQTLPAERNRIYFETRQEAIDAGFVPCKNCSP